MHQFRGWKSVYSFTFRQATSGKGFRFATAIIAILLIAALILINVLVAKPEKTQETEISPIKTVYLLDHSGLEPTDYKAFNPVLNEAIFNHIEFVAINDHSRDELIQEAKSNSPESIAVMITKNGPDYEIEGIIPDGSRISQAHVEELLPLIRSGFENHKLQQSGLTEEQLTAITKPIITSFSNIGDETDEATMIIQMIAPMIFGFMLYMMLLLHGQNVSKSVSTEKTSKLMETLLTSVHPYAMITGKVLAITSIAILQFITWLLAGVIGLYGGNFIARSIYPEYQNTAISMINFVKDRLGDTALTLPGLLIAIIFFCVGFLFYCIFAALAGAMVSKPEDVASTQSLFILPVVISWLITYLAPLMDKNTLVTFTRYIPFTSPFTVPVDVLTGAMGLLEGFISLIILLVFSFLVIILVSRIYKGLVLYTGQKINLRTIGKILKNNK